MNQRMKGKKARALKTQFTPVIRCTEGGSSTDRLRTIRAGLLRSHQTKTVPWPSVLLRRLCTSHHCSLGGKNLDEKVLPSGKCFKCSVLHLNNFWQELDLGARKTEGDNPVLPVTFTQATKMSIIMRETH